MNITTKEINMKITYNELVEMIVEKFRAPISLLEVDGETSRLIKGLPLTYFLRYISKANDEIEEKVDFHIEVVNDGIVKIKNGGRMFILEQDNADNVLNFDIG